MKSEPVFGDGSQYHGKWSWIGDPNKWVIRLGCGKPTGKARDGCVYCDAKTGNLWKWNVRKWVKIPA